MSPDISAPTPPRVAGGRSASAAPSGSTGETSRARHRWDQLGFALFAALAAAYLAALIAAPLPLPQDLPDWAYQGWLLARDFAGDPVAEGFALKPYPVPNTLATLVFAALTSITDAAAATRIAALLPLLLGLPCLWLYAQAAAPRSPGLMVAALLGTLLLTTPFWFGYLNHTLGFVLLMALATRPAAAWTPRALTGWSLLLFFVSAVPFLAFLLLIGWRMAIEERRPQALWSLLPALLLLLWYAAARLLIEHDLAPPEEEEDGRDGPLVALWTHLAWKPLTFTTLGPARDFTIGDMQLLPLPPRLALTQMLAVNTAFALVLAGAILRGLRRERPGLRRMAPGLLLLGGFLAAPPVHFFGMINVGERLLVLAVLLLLPLARLKPRELVLLASLALSGHVMNLWALSRITVEEGPSARFIDNPYRQPLAGRVFILDAIDARAPIPIMPGYATGLWRG